MKEIETFYKTNTELSYKLKRKTAKERLCKIERMTPFAANTVLNQWDAALRSSRAATRPQISKPRNRKGASIENSIEFELSENQSSDDLKQEEHFDDGAVNPLCLGQTLLRAGLINPHQIEVALADAQYREDLRFGEILATRGWIAQETADFFVEQLPYLSELGERKPIGQYFKAAKLLNDEQIGKVLVAQSIYPEKFGKLAVAKHYIKQQTLDYLLTRLPNK